ncbi:hypothetical protein QYM36_010856 [Artemia franciscana]|uniref:Uncharacterized protein n=1 Tax=Artemia franciscana TaxID=6661 RepID=A0AA88HN54_ARTSF|nr:hypothetical protein QYM36_010856 [Artemia franciscana]
MLCRPDWHAGAQIGQNLSLTDLDYADDVGLLSDPVETQYMLGNVVASADLIDLKVCTEKTKFMNINHDTGPFSLTVNQVQLEKVNQNDIYGEEFKKTASNPKATLKIIYEVIRGSPAPKKYSLNVGGEIVRDLDRVWGLLAHHFSMIDETAQSEAAENKELLTEESTFGDLEVKIST